MVIPSAHISPSVLTKQGIPTPVLTIDGVIKLRFLDDVRMTKDINGNTIEMIDNYVVTYDKTTDKFILGPVDGGGGLLPPGNPGDTLYYSFVTGEQWVATNNLYNDSVNIGILTQSPEEPLHVNGNIKLNGNMIFDISDKPTSINNDELNLYVTTSSYFGIEPYNKQTTLYAMNDKNQEIIISSLLKFE